MESNRYIATNLRAVLAEKERSALWLSRKVGVSRSLMGYIVTGQRTASHEVASAVAAVLDVPLFLVFETTSVVDKTARQVVAA